MNPLLISSIVSAISDIAKRFITDPQAQASFQLEALKVLSQKEITEIQASSDVVKAEAQSESWLARNWRPMIMVFFSFLVGSYWFGYTPQNITPEILNELFSIIKLGISGYIVGRSVEKTAIAVAPIISTWKNPDKR